MSVKWRGHEVWTEHEQRGERVKYWGLCSCGWKSTWRASESDATGGALNHLWRVTVAPEYPDKGRMVKRHGETMSQAEFLDALRSTA